MLDVPNPALNQKLGAVKPWVATAADTIAAKFRLTNMSGYRTQTYGNPYSDHPKGLAIDIPAGRATGDAVASYVTANAAALDVKYVIWQTRQWTPATKTWTPMAWQPGAGGSYDPNHLGHVHVSFNSTPPSGGGVVGAVTGAASSAWGAVTGAVSSLNPLAGVSSLPTQASAVALKVAVVVTGLGLLVLGANRLVAPVIGSAVKDGIGALT